MYLYILKYDIKRMRMELHDCDKMHKTIMRMFKSNRKEEGVLFYNDEKDQVIFLQSINKPNVEACTGFSVVHSEERPDRTYGISSLYEKVILGGKL